MNQAGSLGQRRRSTTTSLVSTESYGLAHQIVIFRHLCVKFPGVSRLHRGLIEISGAVGQSGWMEEALFESLVGRDVVLDVNGLYVYLGALVGRDLHYLVLENADVHDLRDTSTTREQYVLESRRHGISGNRRRVLVRRDEVVSISALEDVLE